MEVIEDSDFDTFGDGSVSEESTSVVFPCLFAGVPDARLTYHFVSREYSYYDGDDIRVKGLSSVFISGITCKRTWLQEVWGAPSETFMADNFDSYEKWRLSTPKSGGYLPEMFVAMFKAKQPEETDVLFISFPEHT
jgi:hypothetical protein